MHGTILPVHEELWERGVEGMELITLSQRSACTMIKMASEY